MPNLRKLSPTEVRTLEYTGTSERKHIAAQYDDLLRPFAQGEYGQVELELDEKRPTVRNRLNAAATRRGLTLHFVRTTAPTLRFRVGAQTEAATTPEVAVASARPLPSSPGAASASPAKRRGRPPKTATMPSSEPAVSPATTRGGGRRKRVS